MRAAEPPLVILTSNRTREVHDALKRRCLYQWIDYPSFEKELAIVRAARAARVGGAGRAGDGDGRRSCDARSSTRCPACRRRSTGWRRSSRSIATRSMPTPSTTRSASCSRRKEDIEAVRGRRAAELLERASLDVALTLIADA